MMKLLTDENRKRISEVLFYLALTVELLVMIVEKSDFPFYLESYVFRFTFFLTLLAVLVMKRDRREWLIVAAVFTFTFICYRISGKNDLLRVAAFLMAARDIDIRKAMKYAFFVSMAGFAVIALLSLTGILGEVVRVEDYGRGAVSERRFVFGFGHPNTLFGSMYALLLMWLWIYGRKRGILSYLLITFFTVCAAIITKSRTGLAVIVLTLLFSYVIRLIPKLGEFRIFYILESLFSPVFCLIFAVLAAGFAENAYTGGGIPAPSFYWTIDDKLNQRLSNLYYGVDAHGGMLSNWKLFALPGSDGYFDMGWNRLFYWYGIIPTVIIGMVVLAVIYVCYKKKDIWTLLLIFSISLYTIVEATFVTRYLGRDFFLIIAGGYLGIFFRELMPKTNAREGSTDV